ncbi:MAG: MbtF [Desulfovibrionaceae bacterium]|nr:MbtF [Desulfovibrionaceae bacterium]
MHLALPRFFRRGFIFLVAGIMSLTGCGLFGSDSSHNEEQAMEISVQFQDVHRCSRISPEIRITNPPDGTTSYEVNLIEEDGAEKIILGGGSWAEDGSGIIPEGALTGHYRGPCPPDGKSRKYTFFVTARHDKNPQPLAVRVYNVVME